MEKTCISCRYACKGKSEEPCVNCWHNYRDEWQKLTDEQIELKKNTIFDFRNRLEKRLSDALKSNDVLSVDNLIADVQSEMLKELEDETDRRRQNVRKITRMEHI